MLYSWAVKWHTSAFWRTCWRKRTTSKSGRTFESDRLMPLHWHSWLVISLHLHTQTKNISTELQDISENERCPAVQCALLCLIRCVTISRSELTHPPSMFAHFIFFAPNDKNISLSSSSELFHWVWGLWHLATYVWPQSSWYLKLPIGR